MDTISVIIPVYNVSDVLRRCLNSIIAQTYAALDIILVDDGSTDGSGHICDEYAQLDSRIRVLHTSNQGLSRARNEGLEMAFTTDSKLIAFVDSDDYILPQMFERLTQAMSQCNADIAQCGRRLEGRHIKKDIIPPDTIYDKNGLVNAFATGEVHVVVWDKLYKKEVFDDLRFTEKTRTYEDLYLIPHIILGDHKVCSSDFIGYVHVMNQNSICHTHTMDNFASQWLANKYCYDLMLSQASEMLVPENRTALARRLAGAISRTWRWAYSCPSKERAEYSDILAEMTQFAHSLKKLPGTRKWSITLRVPLALARNGSRLSLIIGYLANQVFIRLFPERSPSRF